MRVEDPFEQPVGVLTNGSRHRSHGLEFHVRLACFYQGYVLGPHTSPLRQLRLGQSRGGARRPQIVGESRLEVSPESARESTVNHPKHTHHGFQSYILLASFYFRDVRLRYAADRRDFLLR
jgi:hypothetical protein